MVLIFKEFSTYSQQEREHQASLAPPLLHGSRTLSPAMNHFSGHGMGALQGAFSQYRLIVYIIHIL